MEKGRWEAFRAKKNYSETTTKKDERPKGMNSQSGGTKESTFKLEKNFQRPTQSWGE